MFDREPLSGSSAESQFRSQRQSYPKATEDLIAISNPHIESTAKSTLWPKAPRQFFTYGFRCESSGAGKG